MSLLFLIGLPGVGKSYWARHVAATYGWSPADIDDLIEAQQQLPVSAIFEQRGEAAFRTLERQTLLQLIQHATGNTIVAAGGGTPCHHNNMENMLQAGTVVYLEITPQQLISRLEEESGKRPLLNNTTALADTLEALLEERRAIYERAHYILPAENISLATFGEIITACINRQ